MPRFARTPWFVPQVATFARRFAQNTKSLRCGLYQDVVKVKEVDLRSRPQTASGVEFEIAASEGLRRSRGSNLRPQTFTITLLLRK